MSLVWRNIHLREEMLYQYTSWWQDCFLVHPCVSENYQSNYPEAFMNDWCYEEESFAVY